MNIIIVIIIAAAGIMLIRGLILLLLLLRPAVFSLRVRDRVSQIHTNCLARPVQVPGWGRKLEANEQLQFKTLFRMRSCRPHTKPANEDKAEGLR